MEPPKRLTYDPEFGRQIRIARIKAGQAAARKEGRYGGNPDLNRGARSSARANSIATRQRTAQAFAEAVAPTIRRLQAERPGPGRKISYAKLALLLNEMGEKTQAGGKWHARTVIDVLRRAKI